MDIPPAICPPAPCSPVCQALADDTRTNGRPASTPASTTLLGKLVTDERRPLVFSVRQTGNQIGAVCGSLALPAIAIWLAPQWSFATVGACAIGGIIIFEWLRPQYEGLAQAPPQLGM